MQISKKMPSPKRTIKVLSALFIGIWLIFIGNGLVLTSAGVMLKEMGVSDVFIGIITSCFFLGGIMSAIFAYSFISSYGYVRSYAIFTALFAISATLHGLGNSIIYWAFLRFLLGFSYYSIVMVVESWINTKSKNEIRSRVLAFYEMLYYGGFGVGVIILALNLNNAKIFAISIFFILLGAIPMNTVKIKEPPLPEKRKLSIPNVFELVPLALSGSFTAGICLSSFFAMSSVFVLKTGGSVLDISAFIFIAMIGGLLSELFFGNFSDKFGRKYSIMLGVFIALVASFFMWFNLENLNILKICVFFLTFGTFSLYALSLARANDMLNNKNESAKVGAELLLSYSIGSLLGPLITGVFIEIFGSLGFVLVYVLILAFLFVFAAFQEVVPKEKRGEFVAKRPSKILR